MRIDNSIAIKTKYDNNYLYNRQLKKIYLCHPLILLLHHCDKENIKFDKFINNQNIRELSGDIFKDYNEVDLEYYKRKYSYYKKNNFFDKINGQDYLLKEIDKSEIINSISNTGQIIFETTTRCNLSCHYCVYGNLYEFSSRENKSSDMNFESIKGEIDQIINILNSSNNSSENSLLYISFYGGEPLLNFSCIQKIVCYFKYTKIKNHQIKFSITTNGTIIKQYISFLVENDFNIFISLDGNKRHNSYRVFINNRPIYNNVIENIDFIRNNYPDFFKKNVCFQSVIHNRNNVEDVNNFFKTKFNKDSNFLEVNTKGVKENKAVEFNNLFKRIMNDVISSDNRRKIEELAFIKLPTIRMIGDFIRTKMDFVFDNYNEMFNNSLLMQYPGGACVPFSKKIFITADNKVFPCEQIEQKYYLFKLLDGKSIREKCDAVAKRYSGYYKSIIGQCSKCYSFSDCGSCFFTECEDDDSSLTCRLFTTAKRLSSEISHALSLLEDYPEAYKRIMEEVIYAI